MHTSNSCTKNKTVVFGFEQTSVALSANENRREISLNHDFKFPLPPHVEVELLCDD